MKPIITEIIIPLPTSSKEPGYIFTACRIKISIQDEGAGPYLCIEGINDDADIGGGENPHQFFLQSAAEIDQFAKICKGMLKGDLSK